MGSREQAQGGSVSQIGFGERLQIGQGAGKIGLLNLRFGQSQSTVMLWQEKDSKIGNAVHAGQEAGQDRNVRSVRDRAVREGLGEADAVGGKRIKCGRFDLLVSIAADMVGAQGIDGDQVHIGRRLLSGRILSPTGNRRKKTEQRQGKSINRAHSL